MLQLLSLPHPTLVVKQVLILVTPKTLWPTMLHTQASQSTRTHLSHAISSQQDDARQMLKNSLKGCTVVIPDLHQLFAGWAEGVNPAREQLRVDVDARLRSYESSRPLGTWV